MRVCWSLWRRWCCQWCLSSILCQSHKVRFFKPFSRPETPKQVLWQTAKTLMKCHIMWHFIRVCAVFYDNQSSEKEIQMYNIFGNYNLGGCDSSIYTMDHLDVIVYTLHVALWKIPLVWKGFNETHVFYALIQQRCWPAVHLHSLISAFVSIRSSDIFCFDLVHLSIHPLAISCADNFFCCFHWSFQTN